MIQMGLLVRELWHYIDQVCTNEAECVFKLSHFDIFQVACGLFVVYMTEAGQNDLYSEKYVI